MQWGSPIIMFFFNLRRKNIDFRWLILENEPIMFFKSNFLENVKEWFKSKQNWYASPPSYVYFRYETHCGVAYL